MEGINIQYRKEVQEIDLENKSIRFSDGGTHRYDQLVSTLPLPELVRVSNAPQPVKQAADRLLCSELLLVNIEVDHPAQRPEHWLYVYDEDKLSTRINFTDLLSPNNAPAGHCGIQVEVYFSKRRPAEHSHSDYASRVVEEMVQMGLILSHQNVKAVHTRWVPWANVIFDVSYRTALDTVLDWLSGYGLVRESDDLAPQTNWEQKSAEVIIPGDILLAGRFGQWKYYWTDDCILRGKWIGERLKQTL